MSEQNNGLVEVEGETGLETFGDNTGLGQLGGGFARLPSVSFFGSKTKSPRLERLQAVGVKPGGFYVQDDGGPVPIPFFFATPANLNVYAKKDGEGKVIAVRPKVKGGWRPDRKIAADKGWDDLLVGIVLAPIGDAGLVAAKIDLFKAVTNVYEKVSGVGQAAANPAAWAARGPLHKVASEASHWFGRFVVQPSVKDEKVKTGGNTFASGSGDILPTPEKFVPLFNDYVQSGAFREALAVFDKIKAAILKKPTDA